MGLLLNLLELKDMNSMKENIESMTEEELLNCFEQLVWLRSASGRYNDLILLIRDEIKQRG